MRLTTAAPAIFAMRFFVYFQKNTSNASRRDDSPQPRQRCVRPLRLAHLEDLVVAPENVRRQPVRDEDVHRVMTACDENSVVDGGTVT